MSYFLYNYSKMIDTTHTTNLNNYHHHHNHLHHPQTLIKDSAQDNPFVDCLINDVDQVVDQKVSDDSDLILNSSTSSISSRYLSSNTDNLNRNRLYSNSSSSQLQQHQTGFSPKPNRSPSVNYNVKFSNDYLANMGKFQYILMAPTSPAVKINEDTLTYLNQGQNYELKLSCNDRSSLNLNIANSSLVDASSSYSFNNTEDIKPMLHIDTKLNENRAYLINNCNETTLNQAVCGAGNEQDAALGSDNSQNDSSSAKNSQNNCLVYLSVIRLCFWDRKLQEIEHEEIKEWEKEYPNARMLEIDKNSSYGIIEVRMSETHINAAEIIWNGKTGANIFFRCNCTSTAFAPHKHGGEKGIHMRFQIDTYEILNNDNKELTINCSSSLSSSGSGTNELSAAYQGTSSSSSLTSILSPPNSSSSPILANNRNSKFIQKDDLDCDLFQQQQQSARQLDTPSPSFQVSTSASTISPTNTINQHLTLDFNTFKHLCGSYCRIQLFRLKGAQRKLKTDRSKVERLNPPDLRKRYQPSNKITILYNCQYDVLYSQIPFVKDANMSQNHHHQIQSHIDTSIGSASSNIDQFTSNGLINNGNDYLLNSSISYHPNSSSSPFIYGTIPNISTPNSGYNSNQIEFINNGNLSTPPLANLYQNFYQQQQTSGDLTPLSAGSTENTSNFFIDSGCQSYSSMSSSNNNQQLTNNCNSNGNILLNSDSNYGGNNYRMKRASSFNSLNNSFTYSRSNKMQKISANNSLNQAQIHSGSQSPQLFNMNMNMNYNSTISSLASSSSSSASSPSMSSPSSPVSPLLSSNLVQTTGNQMNACQNSYTHLDSASINQFTNVSQMSGGSSVSSTISCPLPYDCTSKYVQEWLIQNRFFNLLNLFTNYTSNDVLRLSKEDIINLCGAPDGIRCFNMAHNIQIKPKLTIFITFQSQTYYSAVFLSDWKSNFLISKIFALYTGFVKTLTVNQELKNSTERKVSLKDVVNNLSENSCSTNSFDLNEEDCSSKNELEDEARKSEQSEHDHFLLFDLMLNSPHCNYEYELFLKLKGILVKTTDEVLNNLHDQSKFLIEFEMPSSIFQTKDQQQLSKSNSLPTHLGTLSSSANINILKPNIVKVIMIPLD